MIQQILFDCGGVFVKNHTIELMEKITGSRKTGEFFMERIYLPDSPWPILYDSGAIGKAECTRRLQELIPEMNPAHIEQYMMEWPEWQYVLPTMDTMVDELHALNIPSYLLSNYSCQYEEFRQFVHVLDHMDGEVVSYRTGMVKPDIRIFEHAAKTLQLDPAVTLFVDDKLENIESAAKAGFQTYQFTDPYLFRAFLNEQGIQVKGK